MATDAPSDPLGNLYSAAASLRETAKWLAGGIAATAAGVFAGSSLTKLGSLDAGHIPRLAAALGGVVVGFAALGWVLNKVIAVLTIESMSLAEIADAPENPTAANRETRRLAAELYAKYGHFSGVDNPSSLADIIAKFDLLRDPDAIARAGDFTKVLVADGAFLSVRHRFGSLRTTLYVAIPGAVLGFGVYAWAANPPDPPPAKPCPPVAITITTPPPAASPPCPALCCSRCRPQDQPDPADPPIS